MKFNTAWLLKYLDGSPSHDAVVECLPRAGLEVEVESKLSEALAPVVIGFVRAKEPIADAPGMFACKVEVQKGKIIDLLVGSDHEVKVGWGVPVAPAGTTLPTGKKVQAGKFHGVESHGMICLDGELGLLARDTGMQHWSDESMLGKRLVDVIDVPEYLLELKVLPNRPDCLGILGIAREVAALLNLKVITPAPVAVKPSGNEKLAVEIRDPQLCSRFTGAIFRDVKVAQSPAWLKSVLLTAGMRPINNIVDITNFVMWETGQPMHAFDFDHLDGGQIVVRKLAEGEVFELLTGKKIDKRFGQPLCICDAKKPQALAGIMGGKFAETAEGTKNLMLEVAYFDPVHIRSNVKALKRVDGAGGTDASYRFERGVDPNDMLDYARHRAYGLIVELAGAKLAGEPTDVYPTKKLRSNFTLKADRVSRFLGMDVPASTIQSSLTKLGYEVDASLNVKVPTYRVDVNDPVVLIEDVARMIGYDAIPFKFAGSTPTRGQIGVTDRLRKHIAQQMVSQNFLETKNDPLEAESRSAGFLGKAPDAIVLQNAATAEMAVLRRTLLTGLCASAQRNIFRGAESVRLFEIDRAFRVDALPGVWSLAGVVGGINESSTWRGADKVDFFVVKGLLEDLLESIGLPAITFKPAAHAPMTTTCAEIRVGETLLGYVGELDSKAIKIERASFKLFVFELDIAPLEPYFIAPKAYHAAAKMPPVLRDLAIVVNQSITFSDLSATIRKAGGATLEKLELVDEYKGAQVPKDHRSLAFRLTFRDPTRTLTADEVAAMVDKIVTALKSEHLATLRA